MSSSSSALSLTDKIRDTVERLRRERDVAYTKQCTALDRLNAIKDEYEVTRTSVAKRMEDTLQLLNQQSGSDGTIQKEIQQNTNKIEELKKEVHFQHEELVLKRSKMNEIQQRVTELCRSRDCTMTRQEHLLRMLRATLQQQQVGVAPHHQDEVRRLQQEDRTRLEDELMNIMMNMKRHRGGNTRRGAGSDNKDTADNDNDDGKATMMVSTDSGCSNILDIYVEEDVRSGQLLSSDRWCQLVRMKTSALQRAHDDHWQHLPAMLNHVISKYKDCFDIQPDQTHHHVSSTLLPMTVEPINESSHHNGSESSTSLNAHPDVHHQPDLLVDNSGSQEQDDNQIAHNNMIVETPEAHGNDDDQQTIIASATAVDNNDDQDSTDSSILMPPPPPVVPQHKA